MKELVYMGDLKVYYYTEAPQFTLARRVKGGIVAVRGWTSCRETLINSIETHAFHKKKTIRINRAKFEVLVLFMTDRNKDIDKRHVNIRRYVKRGLKIINHFESQVSWPLTRVQEVVSPRGKEAHLIFMLSASPRWMRNSFLISTYLLMFRAGRSPHIDKWKTHDGLMQKLKTYPGGQDGSTIRNTHDKWGILLKYRDKLNGNRLVKDNFDVKKVCRGTGNYAIGVEGISRLCAGTTKDWLFLNRFASICKKEGKHIPVSKGRTLKKIW